ncbi:MAG: hypothetical protein IJ834_01835 [Paludibacteraceae bacterium]|nr:hypothetical protein [Paludibacteraceae bacterium]
MTYDTSKYAIADIIMRATIDNERYGWKWWINSDSLPLNKIRATETSISSIIGIELCSVFVNTYNFAS